MSDIIAVYTIELPQDKNGNEFEKFMLNEIFPTVDDRLTRIGQITELVLLQGTTTRRSHGYLWLVYGNGLMDGGPARGLIDKIKAFGVEVSLIQDYVESGRWSTHQFESEELALEQDC